MSFKILKLVIGKLECQIKTQTSIKHGKLIYNNTGRPTAMPHGGNVPILNFDDMIFYFTLILKII